MTVNELIGQFSPRRVQKMNGTEQVVVDVEGELLYIKKVPAKKGLNVVKLGNERVVILKTAISLK